MTKYPEWVPMEKDIILFRKDGRPPIIAAMFNGTWETWEGFIVEPETIIGWAKIPEHPFNMKS